MSGNKPAHEIQLGRLSAVVWANEPTGEGRPWFSVSIFRVYQEGGSWKKSTSFGRDDLPVVAKLCDMAYAWIWKRHRREKCDQTAPESTP